MSLINDALNRARAEQRRREAARRGEMPEPFVPGRAAAPAARLWVVGALLLGIGVGAGFTLGSLPRGGGSRGAVEGALIASRETPAAIRAAPPGAVPEASPPAAAVPPSSASGEVGPAAPADTRTEPVKPPSPPTPASTSPSPDAGAGGAGDTASPKQAISSPAEEDATTAAPETHVRVATAPSGTRLELGGIAWSDERPLALINGRILERGESISGLEVIEVHPDRVLLRGPQGRLILRLRE